MAEDSPKVLVVRAHRQCSYVMGTVGDRSMLWVPHIYESGGFLNAVGKVPIRIVTSEAFLYGTHKIMDGGGTNPGMR